MLETISMLIIASYTVAVCVKTKGVPYSISATYFSLKHKLIFGACMCFTAMFLFPVVWGLSTTFMTQLLSVAACIGLIGVGLAPDFRDDWINKIHCGSAALTLIASQIWVGCTPFYWVLLPVWGIYMTYTIISIIRQKDGVFVYKFIKTKPMFWVEVTALATTFLVIYLLKSLKI